MKVLYMAPLLFAAGCAAVGPDYQRPQMALTPTFVGGNSGTVQQLAARAWWQDYRDPMLNDIVRRGLAQGLDVRQAQEAIRQAEAELRETGVNAALSGDATAERVRSGGSTTTTGYRSGSSLSASVVLDMFGGIRRAQEAARANVDAAQATEESTRLAWLADVIAAYGNARYYQQALQLTAHTVKTREETVSITKHQLELGDSTELDLADAQALLDTAKADIPQYQAEFNANVFALATLINEPAGPLMAQMRKGGAPLRTPGTVPTGIPADLLRNRPDVRVLEADLHQAVARVGVATADMLPSVTLSGSVSNSSGIKSWSFGPAVSLPIFNQGALKAARDADVSAAKQAEIAWRAGVLSAVEDVQKGQSYLVQYRLRATALATAAASYTKALGLAQQNYRNGALDLLDLLDTDRSKFSAEISAASAANDAAQEWATLQIATGAGAAIR